jgi:GMP synthase PP-ATPase subunit
VIGAVSGGVDSTVAAKLMHEAIGDRYISPQLSRATTFDHVSDFMRLWLITACSV